MRLTRNFWCPLAAVALFTITGPIVAGETGTVLAPVAPVRQVVEMLHGVALADPYRYFEDAKEPAVQSWLQAQGAVARQTLDALAGRDSLEQRLTALSQAAGDVVRSVVRMPGQRIYYLKRGRNERQFKLVQRTGLTGAERVLVDPEVLMQRTGVPHAINYFTPSWDGRYLAYGVSAGGSEDASLYILNVATGQLVGEPIARVHENLIGWLPDSQSLTYNQLKAPKAGDSDTETYLDSAVMWLRVGQPASSASPVFGPLATPLLGLERLDVGAITFTPGSRWMIARTTDTTLPEGNLFVAPVRDLGKSGLRWKKISGFADKIVEIELKGDDLYLRTHLQAPRYRILRLDLRQARLSQAREVARAPQGGVLESFIVTKDAVVAAVRNGTAIGLRTYRAGDVKGQPVAMPFVGAAVPQADPAHVHTDVLYALSGWSSQPGLYRYDGQRSIETSLRERPAIAGLPDMDVVEVLVPSHDGVMVPMTLLFRKGLVRDGRNPTLLEAYGSYGFSETAHFSAANMVWLERGGVLALANVRGSGVYGSDWYRAGFKATKSNTWLDGVACAQYLIQAGYASPKTLGIKGTSAGGIFVGRSVTAAPELFAAAIFNVGVMDAVRAEDSANGITNISEFGSRHRADEFPALLDMSTYHQIRDGAAYPAVMLVHGLNDPRVDVWHSAKAAARLQAATSSGKPVLLRLDAQAGHGVGSTASQRDALTADMYAFLLWQMGHPLQ